MNAGADYVLSVKKNQKELYDNVAEMIDFKLTDKYEQVNSPAEQLLNVTRSEWNIEAMHWQLDVIFDEDRTALNEKNSQFTLNILRKTVLNIIKSYRNNFEPKLNMVTIMRKCLFDHDILLELLAKSASCS